MMQRDEDLLLEAWLLYHGYLFGFENLAVFDNGSSLPDVTAILSRFEAAGVTVIRDHNRLEDFLQKGDLLKRMIEWWDEAGGYDIAIPLDCDEFLALFTETGITCERRQIHDYLDRFVGRPEVLSVGTNNFNVPGQPGWFWPTRTSKRFFAAGTIGTLDRGFHAGTSRKSDAVLSTHLTHLHFHHKPLQAVLSQAQRKLSPWVDVTNRDALLAHAGDGFHLVKHFRRTEAEYFDQFNSLLTFGYSGLSMTLTALGHKTGLATGVADVPMVRGRAHHASIRQPATEDAGARVIVFDADAYLRANSDVAAQNAILPLEHYLFHGFDERRSLSAGPPTASAKPLAWRDVPLKLPWPGKRLRGPDRRIQA